MTPCANLTMTLMEQLGNIEVNLGGDLLGRRHSSWLVTQLTRKLNDTLAATSS
jgi:hypothetical protein